MKPLAQKYARRPGHAGQRGLVLFIALIALVVISLAAVALIRSVDTATLIAGNLAFKQSATNAGESALIRANAWIAGQIGADGVTASAILNGTDLTNGVAVGYYATMTGLATKNGYATTLSSQQMLSNENTWQADRSGAALVADCQGVQTGNVDCSGNSIRYVIERMCTNVGVVDCSTCLCGPVADSTSSQTIKDEPRSGQLATSSGSPMYRITARVNGPKNTISYIQTFVY